MNALYQDASASVWISKCFFVVVVVTQLRTFYFSYSCLVLHLYLDSLQKRGTDKSWSMVMWGCIWCYVTLFKKSVRELKVCDKAKKTKAPVQDVFEVFSWPFVSCWAVWAMHCSRMQKQVDCKAPYWLFQDSIYDWILSSESTEPVVSQLVSVVSDPVTFTPVNFLLKSGLPHCWGGCSEEFLFFCRWGEVRMGNCVS